MSGGLLGFGGDPDADRKMADDYGVTPEMLTQQRYSTLGNIGAILLAAAQPGPIGQRGQILAKLSDVSGNAASGLKDAVNARMGGLKLKEAQADLTRKAQVREMVANMDGLSPQDRAWAIANPEAFLQSKAQNAQQLAYLTESNKQSLANSTALSDHNRTADLAVQPQRDEQALNLYRKKSDIDAEKETPLETQARVAAEGLKAAGYGDDQSTVIGNGIAAGTHKLTQMEVADPNVIGGKRTVTVIVGPNGPIYPNSAAPGGAPGAAPAAPGGAPASPTGAPLPPNSPLTRNQQTLLDRSTYPNDVAFSSASGGMGGVKEAAATALGQFGGNPGWAKENTSARQFLNGLETETMNTLNEEVPGRNTNMVRQDLKEKHALPIGVRAMPDPQFLDGLKARRDFVQQQLNDVDRQLSNPAALDQKGYNDLLRNKQNLERVIDKHNYAIANFEKPTVRNDGSTYDAPAQQGQQRQQGGLGGTTRSGVTWGIVQ